MKYEPTVLGREVMSTLGALGVCVLLVLVAVSAGAGIASGDGPDAQITDITISDREDVDGDGYASSFQVTVDADTDFPEVGGLGKANPEMEVVLALDAGGRSTVRSAPVGRDRDGTFIFEITGDEVFAQGGGDSDPIAVDPTFSVLTVRLLDADVLSSESVTSLDYVFVDDPLKIEKPANDKHRDVTVTANVEGADVYIDGEHRGETPWMSSFAVDHTKRYGERTVEVRADGYRTASKRVAPNRSTVRLTMERRTKPVIVVSEPDDATVYVDGQTVGQTPWVGEFWVDQSSTISVKKDGYFTKTFTNVSAPRSINASLVSLNTQLIGVSGTEFTFTNNTSQKESSATQNETQIIDVGGLDSSTATGNSTALASTSLLGIVNTTSVLDTAIRANVTAVPDRPRSAETIAFDGLDSYSLFGSIDSYTWSFGDGTTTSGQRVTHSYATPGTYEVALTVEDTDGFRDTVRTRLTVEDRSPRAVFGASRGQVETGQQVTFNGSKSVDPEGQIASYEWDFGDGSVDTGSSATHSYTTAGTYDVTLTVTDGAGNTATVTRTLTVRTPNQPPTASFDASDASPEAGTQVEFDASGSADADGQVQAYGWEFGDGTNATGQRVTHRFASSGTYTVRLSVRDDRGVVRTTTSEVDVAASEGAQPSTSASSSTPATERAVETTAVEESSSDESDRGILAALGNLLRDIFDVFG